MFACRTPAVRRPWLPSRGPVRQQERYVHERPCPPHLRTGLRNRIGSRPAASGGGADREFVQVRDLGGAGLPRTPVQRRQPGGDRHRAARQGQEPGADRG
ncbi:Hypothetical protein SLIV_23298 [Streptomyces lividans TK24]|uniref:Uncharacterized protein n=1 Tax=Streptomyces lividans TK24 TaxID=457428 RepID=A0ABX6TPC3_STRLI|nr:Hypothetical protein SLIV_23298 [Streptomyces lividans TK24]QSJ11162.1 Hypothetical protein SLIVDG2_23298 [Streptomyces lividans]QTD72072.1 Hypothetical protein SLIVYQS_23298 [Streptomyces lividans TK24] [Streptomyces lividans]